MLSITKYDNHFNYKTLENTPDMFHKALKNVLRGEKNFHVGTGNPGSFDLVYEDNDIRAKKDACFPNSDFYLGEMFFPPYLIYDENDKSKINLFLFDGFDEIFFEEVNEYTIVMAKLALEYKDLRITFADNSYVLFPWLKGNINYGITPATENVLYVQSSFLPVYTKRDRFCTTCLFHCLFMLQWMTDLPREKLKYISFAIKKTEGIGSVLSTCSQLRQTFSPMGIELFIAPGSTRFSSKMLSKYFTIGDVPADSCEDNTAYVNCFNCFVLTHLSDRNEAKIGLDMLNPSFVQEMKEYADQIIAEKKVLGVLLRGTDYVVANFAGSYRPAPFEDCKKIIKERMEKYSYDKIFLATEDSALLEEMKAAFPHKIMAISQERHTVSEVQEVKYLSELEKKQYTGNAYEASVEDTTVNYYYAMYMLSRCESLISNCMCSGVKIATSLKESSGEKSYARCEIISDIIAASHEE